MRSSPFVFLLILILTTTFSFTQNPFVGTWTCYKLEALSRKQKVVDATQKNFKSEFIFYADSTFVQTGTNVKRVGRYVAKENWLIFYMVNKKGEWETSFSIRWPNGEKDPVPRTPEFDFMYPELLPVIDKKGKITTGDVDAYYKKQSN